MPYIYEGLAGRFLTSSTFHWSSYFEFWSYSIWKVISLQYPYNVLPLHPGFLLPTLKAIARLAPMYGIGVLTHHPVTISNTGSVCNNDTQLHIIETALENVNDYLPFARDFTFVSAIYLHLWDILCKHCCRCDIG